MLFRVSDVRRSRTPPGGTAGPSRLGGVQRQRRRTRAAQRGDHPGHAAVRGSPFVEQAGMAGTRAARGGGGGAHVCAAKTPHGGGNGGSWLITGGRARGGRCGVRDDPHPQPGPYGGKPSPWDGLRLGCRRFACGTVALRGHLLRMPVDIRVRRRRGRLQRLWLLLLQRRRLLLLLLLPGL